MPPDLKLYSHIDIVYASSIDPVLCSISDIEVVSFQVQSSFEEHSMLEAAFFFFCGVGSCNCYRMEYIQSDSMFARTINMNEISECWLMK